MSIQEEVPISIEGSDAQGSWKNNLKCYMKKMSIIFDLESHWGRGLYITAYMIVIFMHPFHYYAYVIKHNPNCLEIQYILYWTFAVVALFNTYMLLYIPMFIKRLLSKSLTAVKMTRFFFTQIPVLLMTLTICPNLTTGTRDRIFLTTTNLFLFGYVLLVIGLSLIIKSASEASVAFARAKWAKAVFNLLLYLHGGHVFGAVWYCFAIDRVLACWREDYFARNNVDPRSFVCVDEALAPLNCPKLTQDDKVFGIFHDAISSGVVEMRDFVKKFLYCLRWGLQVLSCFGQNLVPGTSNLENIYVISVVVYSTVLFVFLIGNMQTFLQSESKKPADIIINSINLGDRLIKLKEVKEFENWEEAELKELCSRIKPVIYADRTLIVREGDTIREILFVLRGELWTYTSSRGIDNSNNKEIDSVKDGDCFGKELVDWVKNPSSNFPISTRNVLAVKQVEAFVLTAYDLKDVHIDNPPQTPKRSPRSSRKNKRSVRCFEF